MPDHLSTTCVAQDASEKSAPFVISCQQFRVKNSKGALYWHVFHFHNAERHFTCSGTKQLRTMMSIYQCELYRGRRLADCLRRSAAFIRSSVGDLSCSHRLNVDKEFRLVLSGSGPRFMSKDSSTGTLPVRRVGNMYYDREFGDVLLRHLLQSGSRVASFLNRFQYDIQLRGCACWARCFPRMRKPLGQ